MLRLWTASDGTQVFPVYEDGKPNGKSKVYIEDPEFPGFKLAAEIDTTEIMKLLHVDGLVRASNE